MSYRAELQSKAEELIPLLQEFEPEILEDSFREYAVQVALKIPGFKKPSVTIHYSPKKRSYSFTINGLKDELIQREIQELLGGKVSARSVVKKDGEKAVAEKAEVLKSDAVTPDAPQQIALGSVQIYVDGSFISGKIGYGIVILKDGKLAAEFCGAVPPDFHNSTRQVAGELFAVGKAIQWCRKNGVTDAEIFYDYEGIEKWATGAWKANLELTKKYQVFIRSCGIKIKWRKVKSHTGDYWNERADVLAKEGCYS
jgi:ribonuclease HI